MQRLPLALAFWLVLLLFNLPGATTAEASARVYLMRGLFDVSTGLDELASKLKRRGVPAVIGSYTDQAKLAETAIRAYRSAPACPVVIIGHSLGADAAIEMANALRAASVPVGLLVAFSPAHSSVVPANVARAVNYYQSNSVWNNVYSRGNGFKGTLRNVNLAQDDSIHHFNIEKAARLHSETMQAIAAINAACATAAQPKASATGPAAPSQ